MTVHLLASPVRVLTHYGTRAVAMVDLDPTEPVFAGHYPGFPVLPGVYLVDCVCTVAGQTAPEAAAEPDVIESVRFLAPVLPGDRITIELRWTRADDGWHCAASVNTELGKAASVRLHYSTVAAA
jgi:3-hydroxyacyl-[acyl-carrier-protein] dehydratase